MMKEKKLFRQLTSREICQIYELLRSEGLLAFQLNENASQVTEAIVANINGHYFGKENYSTHEERAVAYFYFLIKDHPFVDGNKRTATLVFQITCELNDLVPHFKDFGLDELAVAIEEIKPKNHQVFIRDLAELLFKNDQ